MKEKGGLPENPHENHRDRLRQRFLAEGLENFQKHEILELLLFYAIPRMDTNVTAHRLMSRYGKLSSVLDASFEDLAECKGIGANAATLLKLMPSLTREYLIDKSLIFPKFGSLEKLGKFLVSYFCGYTREKLTAIYLTADIEVIDIVTISDGTVNASEVSVRRIAEEGFCRRAAYVVLAHNHPQGEAEPSREDIAISSELARLFYTMGMPLLDHFIIGNDSYRSIYSMLNGSVSYD